VAGLLLTTEVVVAEATKQNEHKHPIPGMDLQGFAAIQITTFHDFRGEAGRPLSDKVEREYEAYRNCGRREEGFLRVQPGRLLEDER